MLLSLSVATVVEGYRGVNSSRSRERRGIIGFVEGNRTTYRESADRVNCQLIDVGKGAHDCDLFADCKRIEFGYLR